MTIKTKTIPRRWTEARRKLLREGQCRVCASQASLEAGHVIGRRCDPIMQGPKGGEYRYVHPDSIVPLCGDHHRLYDSRDLDLLPYLHLHEQTRAVEDAGGIMGALKRICGRGSDG